MNPLSQLLSLSKDRKIELGLVHTPAEIAQQPATWRTTHHLFRERKTELMEFLQQAKTERWTIFLVGAGTSDYIGHSIAHLLRKRWNCEVCVVASTDLLTNRDDLVLQDRKYLWISFSRSGDSPEGVSVLEQALQACSNVKHLVVSCNRDGRMVQLAMQNERCFAVVLDDAVNDRSLAMTSSFTNMVLSGMELAHIWDLDDFDQTLKDMTQAANYMLEEGASLAQRLAKQRYRRACFVGSGALAGATRESALKILELTAGNIQTMNETTLGLRHGPMSSLNDETLFVSFVSKDDRRRRYDLDLLNEIRAKRVVRTIVAVGHADGASDANLYCDALGRLDDAYRPAVDVIFSQMLGLFSSIELGLHPDSPSPNGVISRVVEQFTIYA